MITPCHGENGCGTLLRRDMSRSAGSPSHGSNAAVSGLPRSQMTDFMPQVPGTTDNPTASGMAASQIPRPDTLSVSGAGMNSLSDLTAGAGMNPVDMSSGIPGQPDTPASMLDPVTEGGSSVIPEGILPENPVFQVPANPLLPPGYQEVISYENVQYLNGFLRTQIGRYIRVEQLIGSSQTEDRYGFLVGVGINYILLQDYSTGNISAMDYYSIKYVYIYYSSSGAPSGR